jgi:polyisoprenoid-binding protein YceI
MPVSIVRRHAFKALAAATVLTFGALAAPLVLATAPTPAAPAQPPSVRSVANQDATRVELVVGGSEARYRASEVFAGRGFNEAVGRTSAVQGAIVLGADGTVMADQSKIVVDLSTLTSDSGARDNYIKRNTLKTDQFPNAELTITSAPGLPQPLPASGSASFQLVGDLTVHGVTRPATWDATATFADGQVTGTATTTVLMSDFGMETPRTSTVLSVEDSVKLELDVKGTVAPSIAELLSVPS